MRCYKLLALIILITACQSKELTVSDYLEKLPDEYLLVRGTALDSLISFGEYLDPKGDSIEQVKYTFYSEKNVAEISMNFVTGQSGFRTLQLKQLDDSSIITCYFSGSKRAYNVSQLDLFFKTDLGLKKKESKTLNSIQNRDTPLEITKNEDLNGVSGCDFFTEMSNMVRFYYEPYIENDSLKSKTVSLLWNGTDFELLNFKD